MEMRKLKTKDLPKMTRMIKKAGLLSYLRVIMDKFMEQDVSQEVLDSLEDKTEEEQIEILEQEREKILMSLGTDVLEKLIEGYDLIHDDFNDFLAGLYGVSVKEVEEWELDVFMSNVLRLREQEMLPDFFKTASQSTQ